MGASGTIIVKSHDHNQVTGQKRIGMDNVSVLSCKGKKFYYTHKTAYEMYFKKCTT